MLTTMSWMAQCTLSQSLTRFWRATLTLPLPDVWVQGLQSVECLLAGLQGIADAEEAFSAQPVDQGNRMELSGFHSPCLQKDRRHSMSVPLPMGNALHLPLPQHLCFARLFSCHPVPASLEEADHSLPSMSPP